MPETCIISIMDDRSDNSIDCMLVNQLLGCRTLQSTRETSKCSRGGNPDRNVSPLYPLVASALTSSMDPISPGETIPSLIHSPSSETTVTVHSGYPDIHTTPGRNYALNMHSSSSSSGSIDMLSMMTLAKQPAGNSMPSTPEYARSRSSHSARNSTLDLARATHLEQSSGSTERRAGFADKFEKIAPK
jgi:hypothetical protein